MLTYEELQPVFYTIAPKFVLKFKGRYEIDELINAVWVMGNVRKLSDIRLAWARVYYDMVDYIRTQQGRLKSLGDKPSYMNKHYSNIVSLSNEDIECQLFIEEDPIKKVDFEEELELLLKGGVCNNRSERSIVKLRLDGFYLREIGKIIGVSESRVSQILINIGKRLLVNIKDKGVGYNKQAVQELISC